MVFGASYWDYGVMNEFLTYLFLGTFCGFLMETLLVRVSGQSFTMGERLFLILLWPLSLLIFIIGFFRK